MCYIPLSLPDTRWIALVGGGKDGTPGRGKEEIEGPSRIILQIIFACFSRKHISSLFFRRTTFCTAGRIAGVGNAPAEAKFFDGTALPNVVMGLRSSGLRRHRVFKNLPGGGALPGLSLELSVRDGGNGHGRWDVNARTVLASNFLSEQGMKNCHTRSTSQENSSLVFFLRIKHRGDADGHVHISMYSKDSLR